MTPPRSSSPFTRQFGSGGRRRRPGRGGPLDDGSTLAELPTTLAVAGNQVLERAAAGAYHTAIASSWGDVWTWGWNGGSQLGDATLVDRHPPAQIPSISGVTSVSAGFSHTLAVVNGSVLAWGLNPTGQLGDGTLTNRPVPVAAVGPAGATAVGAGGPHSVAL